jgi:hypothetical protein
MFQAEVIVVYGMYECQKSFSLSVPPQTGWILRTGATLLHVKHITQNLDTDSVRVFCGADSLATLWELFSKQKGWTVNNPDAFQADPAVTKAVRQYEERMARIRAQIGG